MEQFRIVDSHTGGEPTRVVIHGFPSLGAGTVAEQARVFEAQFDHFRKAIVNEPRGSDILVGALLVSPKDPAAQFGVLFFNNVGSLGMCGHGTIGLVQTLAHLRRIEPGTIRIETSVGTIAATLFDDGRVSVQNVPSFRQAKAAAVNVPGYGLVTGDVAWGGNWFFLVGDTPEVLRVENAERLVDVTWAIRRALEAEGIRGRTDLNGGVIDHIELFGAPVDAKNHSRNFVLCPGKAYDRSPCGTGTSAKIACLAADGKLKPGDIWKQESITGSVFEASFERNGEEIIPIITGRAFVTAEATLILDPNDPLRYGF